MLFTIVQSFVFDVIYFLFFMSLIGLIYFHGMPDNIIFYRGPC